MRIAVIGAGFTGLSAAYHLAKKGHEVTIFEKDLNPGGLAIGFKTDNWEWSLEKHYHHWFANDTTILTLAKEIGYEVFIKRPKTSVFVDEKIYQLDSPANVLTFPKLSFFERIRMATVLAGLKYNPFWQKLEGIKASEFLPKAMGNNAYQTFWEPQLHNKFGGYINEISLAWFWARIKKRTVKLAYPKGGFLSFANALVKKIEQHGGKFFFNTEVYEMKQLKNFDKIIVTLPSFYFLKIAPQLPENYKQKLLRLKGLGAINLILRLKKPFLTDGTYWLSICDKKSKVMAVVEHANFMDKKYYNNEHIVYIGNYLPHDHPYMGMSADELLKVYDPYLKKINPTYHSSLIASHLFKVPFAQPIIPLNYSKIIPPFETPLKNIYLANIQQVYPWDRGTNYAVELGEKIAQII
ncbi:MAG: NAD(P)/FAD-dependent oxidoreductase [Candidatus Levybacteria bacterium]|nr:NAD(P)/FAD-dependent oxidoreductase [Candidatus Levybacteria bacterium]